MMVDIGQLEVLKILASASNIITTGELMQLSNAYGGELAIDAYFTTIYRKTGKLFEAAAEIPALLTHPENVVYREACQQFGALLGTAFQIADDILDYQSTAEDMGKNVGDDVREGKLTLPVLYALERATPTQRAWIKHMFSEGDDSDIDQLFDVVKQTGALQRASEKALELAEQAAAFLEALPQNAYTTGLRGLVALAVNRVC
jgi:octaprenyl-diphosphate synthase